MDDKMESQLAKVIEKAMDVAEKTGEFVIEQAPDLLREFYAWHIAEHCFLILASFFAISVPWILKRILPECENEYDSINYLGKNIYGGAAILSYIIGGFISVLGLVGVFANVLFLVKILVAPKIYLIDYFLQ